MVVLKGIQALVTSGALGAAPFYYAWSDHHGDKRWVAYEAASEAKGEILDFAKLLDKTPIPDAQNFAAHPVLAELFGAAPPAAEGLGNLRLENIAGLGWSEALRENWRGWQMAQATPLRRYIPDGVIVNDEAEHILRALAPYRKTLLGVAAAAERPKSRFPIDWSELFAAKVTHYTGLQNAARTLGIEASVRIHLEEPDAAFLAVVTNLRIANHLQGEPTLINHLVETTIRAIGYQALWEGLKAGIWDDAELERLDRILAAAAPDTSLLHCLRTERAFGVAMLLSLAERDDALQPLAIFGGGYRFLDLLPRGFWKAEAIALCELYEEVFFGNEPLPGYGVPMYDEGVFEQTLFKGRFPLDPRGVFVRLGFPAIGTIVQRSLKAGTQVRLARVAIALERYRLANRAYPKTLELVPARWLDPELVDPITGRAFRYTLRPDGTPAIWSVGENGIDEGGRTKRRQHGDWAWQYMLPEGHSIEEYDSRDPIPPAE